MSLLIEQIKQGEGFRPTWYRCPSGVDTIGYGTTRPELERQGYGDVQSLTKAGAERLLRGTVEHVHGQMQGRTNFSSTFGGLDHARRDVVVELAYVVGVSGCLKFRKMWLAIKAGDWATAANELLDSKFARQVKGRAWRMAAQLASGRYTTFGGE